MASWNYDQSPILCIPNAKDVFDPIHFEPRIVLAVNPSNRHLDASKISTRILQERQAVLDRIARGIVYIKVQTLNLLPPRSATGFVVREVIHPSG